MDKCKTCPICRQQNPPMLLECSNCEADLSSVPIRSREAERPESSTCWQLESLDGKYRFLIREEEMIIGRNAAMQEYLQEKSYVSRIHARLTFRSGQLIIENLSSTNFTYINNNKISDGEMMVLQAGDEIGLGGMMKEGGRQAEAAYFCVKCEEI